MLENVQFNGQPLKVYAIRTNVLSQTEILDGSSHVLDTGSDKTPFHERCPKEYGFRSWRKSSGCMSTALRRELPAGWFMKRVILEVAPAVAAPDMVGESGWRRRECDRVTLRPQLHVEADGEL